MAKTKTPFLSLGSSGTVGGVLTSQKSGGDTILRKTPVPTDPYSLAQAYQRWDYRDYAYLWTLLTNSEKQVYRTRASRYHITGFSLWMREHLKTLPDLGLRLHLDEKSGAIAFDSSKNATNGVIFGASPAVGIIDGAFFFILNDYIEITCPQLNYTSGDFSIIVRAYLNDDTIQNSLFSRGSTNSDGYDFLVDNVGRLILYTSQAAANQASFSAIGEITSGSWLTLGLTRAGASVLVYKNGDDITATFGAHIDPLTSARTAKIGIHDNKTSFPTHGRIDEVANYNRALSPLEHKRHAERRYPS